MFVIYLIVSIIVLLLCMFAQAISPLMMQIWILVTITADAFIYTLEMNNLKKSDKEGKDA